MRRGVGYGLALGSSKSQTFGCVTVSCAFNHLSSSVAATNEPSLGNFICADSDPLDGTHWIVYYWTGLLVIEGILLSMALWKAWQHRPALHGSALMQELTKDSVFYFFASVLAKSQVNIR